LQAEPLESRLLLAADMPLHNWLIPEDVNHDFYTTPLDVVQIVNILNQDASAEAEAQAEGPQRLISPDVNDDGAVSPIDALGVINFLNAEGEGETMRYILRTFDATGQNEIDAVGVGQQFQLQVWVDDCRDSTMTNSPGTFAAYLDVLYDSSLGSVAGAVKHNTADFGNAPNANLSQPGVLDAVGSFSKSFSPTTFDPQLLWTLDFTAEAPGTLTFTGEPTTDQTDPGDTQPTNQSPKFDTNMFGINDPICPAASDCVGSMGFLNAEIDIVEDVLAVDDSATMAEDSGFVTVNVLSNDVVNNPVGGTPILDSFDTNPSNGSVTQVGNSLRVTPDLNYNGDIVFSYTMTNGQGAFSSADVTVTVTPVNDGPVNSVPGDQAIDEDNSLVFSSGVLSVSDVDADDADTDPGITVSLTVNHGTLTVGSSNATVSGDGSGNVQIDGSVANVNGALNGLTYAPNMNYNGSDTLTMNTSDKGNTGPGSALTANGTVNITINPINDAPVNTVPGSQVVFNTETLSFNASQFQVADVDATTLEVNLSASEGTVSLGNTSGLTVTGNNSMDLTASGSISNLNTALNSLTYDPTDGYIGSDTLTMTTSDLGQSGAGGTLTDTDSVLITVTPPEVPFAASDVFQVDEDSSATNLDVLANDLKPDPQASNTLSITQLNGVDLTGSGQTDTTSNGGTVTFTGDGFTYKPADDFFGDDTFTYTIESDPDPGDGPSTGTVTVQVQPINDGPSLTVPGAQTVGEDNTLSFTGGNMIDVEDIDAGSAGVTVTLTVGNGVLDVPLNGTQISGDGSGNVTLNGTVSQVNGTLGGLTYTPDSNYAGSDTLTVNVNDNGNTGGNPLSATDTVDITVQPINDAPVIVVPGSQTFITDFDNVFSAANGNPFSISDVDADGADVQVDLTISDGTFTLSNSSNVSVSQNPGGQNGIRVAGSVAHINEAFNAGITYRTTDDGFKTLTATVNDLGNTGGVLGNPNADNPLTDSDIVELEVLDFVPSDIGGYVFVDVDDDSRMDKDETPLEQVEMRLSGVDFRGVKVNETAYTDENGYYSFMGIKPGDYTLNQVQPVGMIDGQESLQSPLVHAGNDSATLSIPIKGDVVSLHNNFGERGLRAPFLSLADLLASSAHQNSVLIGENGAPSWALTTGLGWAGYSEFRLQSNSSGGYTLSAKDSSGQTHSAVFGADSPHVRQRSDNGVTVSRIIGTAEEIFGTNGAGEGEGEAGDALAQADAHQYREAVDEVFADETMFA
jgi:hypothetical protein